MKALRERHKPINQRVTTAASTPRMGAAHKNESNHCFIAIGGSKAMQIFHTAAAMRANGDAFVDNGTSGA
jgi:hypothetical protein